MKKNLLKTHHFMIQAIYSAVCLVDVVICLLYRNLDNAFVDDVLLFAMLLLLLPVVSAVIVVPVSIVHNIQQVILSYKGKLPRRHFQLMWTIFSPILYVACFSVTAYLFVSITGGG